MVREVTATMHVDERIADLLDSWRWPSLRSKAPQDRDDERLRKLHRQLEAVVSEELEDHRRRRLRHILPAANCIREQLLFLRQCLHSTSPLSTAIYMSRAHVALSDITKHSEEEEYRKLATVVGVLDAVAENLILEVDAFGVECGAEHAEIRKLIASALTNLTFGNAHSKRRLCAYPNLIDYVIMVIDDSHKLAQVYAGLLRNLSWMADAEMSGILSPTVAALTRAALRAYRASETKCVCATLSALWNLASHSRENKKAICEQAGFIDMIIELLTTEAQHTTLVEPASGVLKYASMYLAAVGANQLLSTSLLHKMVLRLVDLLNSPSFTIIGNALGVLSQLLANDHQLRVHLRLNHKAMQLLNHLRNSTRDDVRNAVKTVLEYLNCADLSSAFAAAPYAYASTPNSASYRCGGMSSSYGGTSTTTDTGGSLLETPRRLKLRAAHSHAPSSLLSAGDNTAPSLFGFPPTSTTVSHGFAPRPGELAPIQVQIQTQQQQQQQFSSLPRHYFQQHQHNARTTDLFLTQERQTTVAAGVGFLQGGFSTATTATGSVAAAGGGIQMESTSSQTTSAGGYHLADSEEGDGDGESATFGDRETFGEGSDLDESELVRLDLRGEDPSFEVEDSVRCTRCTSTQSLTSLLPGDKSAWESCTNSAMNSNRLSPASATDLPDSPTQCMPPLSRQDLTIPSMSEMSAKSDRTTEQTTHSEEKEGRFDGEEGRFGEKGGRFEENSTHSDEKSDSFGEQSTRFDEKEGRFGEKEARFDRNSPHSDLGSDESEGLLERMKANNAEQEDSLSKIADMQLSSTTTDEHSSELSQKRETSKQTSSVDDEGDYGSFVDRADSELLNQSIEAAMPKRIETTSEDLLLDMIEQVQPKASPRARRPPQTATPAVAAARMNFSSASTARVHSATSSMKTDDDDFLLQSIASVLPQSSSSDSHQNEQPAAPGLGSGSPPKKARAVTRDAARASTGPKRSGVNTTRAVATSASQTAAFLCVRDVNVNGNGNTQGSTNVNGNMHASVTCVTCEPHACECVVGMSSSVALFSAALQSSSLVESAQTSEKVRDACSLRQHISNEDSDTLSDDNYSRFGDEDEELVLDTKLPEDVVEEFQAEQLLIDCSVVAVNCVVTETVKQVRNNSASRIAVPTAARSANTRATAYMSSGNIPSMRRSESSATARAASASTLKPASYSATNLPDSSKMRNLTGNNSLPLATKRCSSTNWNSKTSQIASPRNSGRAVEKQAILRSCKGNKRQTTSESARAIAHVASQPRAKPSVPPKPRNAAASTRALPSATTSTTAVVSDLRMGTKIPEKSSVSELRTGTNIPEKSTVPELRTGTNFAVSGSEKSSVSVSDSAKSTNSEDTTFTGTAATVRVPPFNYRTPKGATERSEESSAQNSDSAVNDSNSEPQEELKKPKVKQMLVTTV